MSNSFSHTPVTPDTTEKDTEYPKWMYGPGGQSQIFQRDDEVPEGWEDHPKKVKESTQPETPQTETNKGTAENGAVDETGAKDTPSTDSPATSGDAPLTDEEITKGLENKSMNELYAMAGKLNLKKEGKKAELIEKIREKLKEAE